MNKLFQSIILVTAFLLTPGISFAQNASIQLTSADFPACANPQGALKASYTSGIHGIPGSTATYAGSDKVYELQSSDQLMQCFCADDGTGIQTNWLKIKDLNEKQIESYKDAGWIFVPNGANWGLNAGAYLALNSNYSCKASSGNVGGSSSSNTGGGSDNKPGILSTSTQSVIGLATTGNTKLLVLVSTLGTLFLLLGLKLRRAA